MKKIFILMTAFLLSTSAFAQTSLHTNQGLPIGALEKFTSTLVTFEGSHITDNSVSYALLQSTFAESNSTFGQFFHEFKFWKDPIYGHIELRTYNLSYNVVFFGLAYSLSTSHGLIAVEPLYRNSSLNLYGGEGWKWNASSFQLSIVTEHDWNLCNLSTFTDFWTRSRDGNGAGWYTEVWLYFPVYKSLQTGSIIQLGAEEGFNFSYVIYPGIKILF